MASKLKLLAAALATAGLLVACGGGGGADTTPKAKVTSVKVMGDSLADSGTFGFKFTVQGSALTGAGSTPIWPERIADQFSQSLCAHYRAGDENLTTYQEVASCTNYAVGGGRVNPLDAPTSPKSVLVQIQAASKAGFSADDLVIIDGGANDAADVIGALIAAARGNSQPLNAMVAWLDSKAPGTSTALMTQAGGDASKFAGLAAGAYLQTLAKTLAGSIAQNVIAKGATRVAVLNVPAITKTPRFQMVLASIAQAAGGGETGAAAAAKQEAAFDSLVQVFNTQLAASLAGQSQVALVDFYTEFKSQISNPAQYDFDNVKDPVCPATGVDGSGLPTYTFPTCTAAALSATPGKPSPDWWQHHVFADSFHPTPYGHQQLSQLVARSLSQKGWL
ncbi:MAG: SGNH/GDSL hydrolase family protein [Comamonas sp.]